MDNKVLSSRIMDCYEGEDHPYMESHELDEENQSNMIKIEYTCEDLISISSEKIREEMEQFNKVNSKI